VPFKPGLQVVEASLFETQTGALSGVTFVEGPDREEQFTLVATTLLNRHIRSYEVEILSPLFPAFNNAAHESQQLVSLVGREKIDFTIYTKPIEPWNIHRSPRDAFRPRLRIVGSIYPSPDNPLRTFIRFNFGSFMQPVVVSARRLGEGFMTASLWLVVMLGSATFLGVGGIVFHAEKEGERRHKEAMAALKKCTPYTMDCDVGLSTKAKVDTPGNPVTADVSLKNRGKVTVHRTK
jgi:hypothetical protein